MSGSCQAAGKQADTCNQDPGLRTGDGYLEIRRSPAKLVAHPDVSHSAFAESLGNGVSRSRRQLDGL